MGRTTKRKRLAPKQKEIEEAVFTSKEATANTVTQIIEENLEDRGNNIGQMEVNIENNDVRIRDDPTTVVEDAMQVEENVEEVEGDGIVRDDIANSAVRRKPRGPTKAKRLPSNPSSRTEVEFDLDGKPIGEGSVKLSSYLGPLVRELVPVTLDNWKKLSDELRFVLWESIQARFKLDEQWHKACIFQQMGCIFRASKSRLVREIMKARNEEERLQLKPDNVKSIKEWKTFVKSKTNSEFKLLSEKFKAIRNNQLPHTCSRRGMARLAEDLKENSLDPSSVSRVQVWIKSRTRKNGEPVSTNVANTIEKIKNIASESHSRVVNYNEDALTQVLGADRPGRLRGFGRGMTKGKATHSYIRDKQTIQMQNKISELDALVRTLMKNQGKESWGEASTPSMRKHDKNQAICNLLDWSGTDEIVAEGRMISSDPKEFVQQIPLGSGAMKVMIDFATNPDAFLWRPTINFTRIGEVQGDMVAWPSDRVVLRHIDPFENEQNMSNDNNIDHKCKLIDWNGSEVVAEGRLHSADPKLLVNDVPLGPSAMAVSIDNPKNPDAFLWRPTIGLTRVGEAIGVKVAWPESKVVVEKVNTATSANHTINAKVIQKSANSVIKGKCKLTDWSGTGDIVANGRVSSTDPSVMVHCVPLGKNAIKVWVDNAIVPKAQLWRPTSDLEFIEDAIGAPIAWPAANVIMESISGN